MTTRHRSAAYPSRRRSGRPRGAWHAQARVPSRRSHHGCVACDPAWCAAYGSGCNVRPMTDLTWLDATAQAELIRTGEASPKELVEAAIARIDAVNPELDAVIRTRFDEARSAAGGELPDGPFRGVPILFKDLGCTVAGEPTAFGIGPLNDFPWPVTSFLAEQFLAAGFVPLGSTNVPEFGTTVTTEPKSFPPARNPWNTGHSTGGSSRGSAAAEARRLASVGHAHHRGGAHPAPAGGGGAGGAQRAPRPGGCGRR